MTKSNDPALDYENLVRCAFGMKLGQIDRWGDPAGLADTDRFDEGNFVEVKAALSYSMFIYLNHLSEHRDLPQDEEDRIRSIVASVISAESLRDVALMVDEYFESVIRRYFEPGGYKVLKP